MENKIDFLKEALEVKGYSYKIISDFCVEIDFNNCTVFVQEALSENLHFKVVGLDGNVIFSKSYKTINSIFKYGFKKIIR